MRIKNYFKVSEGTRVTENVFSRVLISSVCSILLSMACLFGTTWAWFSASSEVTDNVIATQLNTHILVHLCENDTPLDNLTFEAGQWHTIRVENPAEVDGLGQKSKLCVVFSAHNAEIGYIMLDEYVDITFQSETDATLFWTVFWGEPQCWPENMKKDIDELDISEIVIIPDAPDNNTEVYSNTDGDNTEGDNTEGDNTDGDNADGDNADGDNTDGDNTDGDNIDGDNTDGDNTDGDNTDGDNTDGDNTDGDNTEGDNTEGDNTEGDNTDGDNTDGEETT